MLCKESQHDCSGLSALLATLPDPSLSHGKVEAMPVTEARERGLIPKACKDTLRAFSSTEMKLYQHATHYKWVKTLDKNSDKNPLVSN